MVRCYDDLSEDEIKKLDIYLRYRMSNLILLVIMAMFFCVLFVGLFASLFLKDVSSVFSFIFGIVMLQVVMFWISKKLKKECRMIFGFDNVTKHIFNIDDKELKVGFKELIEVDKGDIKDV